MSQAPPSTTRPGRTGNYEQARRAPTGDRGHLPEVHEDRLRTQLVRRDARLRGAEPRHGRPTHGSRRGSHDPNGSSLDVARDPPRGLTEVEGGRERGSPTPAPSSTSSLSRSPSARRVYCDAIAEAAPAS